MRNLSKKNRPIIGKRTVRASRSTALRKRASVSATRRYARPMRSIRAARTETIQYLDFNELDERQKKQAVENFMNSDTAYEWFSEDQMLYYEDSVGNMADELERKTGIEVDTGKLYWQENSQGPYPEWNLNRAIDTYSGETRDGISYDIEFDGSLTVKAYVTMYDEDGNEIDYDNVPAEIEQKITAVQDFIDDLWSCIHEICTSYPDEQWCYEMLEANNYEFRVDNAGNVVSMA